MVTLIFVGLLGYAAYNGYLMCVHLMWAFLGIMMLPIGIWMDVRFYRRRRLAHPDQNWHNLPLLNAVGFDRNGAWILPGTPAARQLQRWKDGIGRRP